MVATTMASRLPAVARSFTGSPGVLGRRSATTQNAPRNRHVLQQEGLDHGRIVYLDDYGCVIVAQKRKHSNRSFVERVTAGWAFHSTIKGLGPLHFSSRYRFHFQ